MGKIDKMWLYVAFLLTLKVISALSDSTHCDNTDGVEECIQTSLPKLSPNDVNQNNEKEHLKIICNARNSIMKCIEPIKSCGKEAEELKERYLSVWKAFTPEQCASGHRIASYLSSIMIALFILFFHNRKLN